ncbi:M20/M25/M40 family metallo-hydrolase [Bacteroidales bacterium OttesenSCG-928-M11]|nr:M20/M25/M40 family metallo-hydrolase [Bacteroidales bacterium OttesenSCG-928-M11]
MKIDEYYYNAIDLLKKMIAIRSVSREETLLADMLEDHLKKMNFVPSRKGNNLWISSREWKEGKPVILLNSHIDTVKPVAGWTKNPYVPEEIEGKLYGLGSNDAGASLVSLLSVFLLLTSKEQDYNLIFLASAEEEVSGKEGIELALVDLPPVSFAIVGEPTAMQPAIAERGLMVLDCVVEGRSGHAARNEGENAIYKTFPIIDWFRTKQFPRKSDLLGEVKMTVTMINSGTQHNVIPDKCTFTVDVRTNELYSNQELYNSIVESMENCKIEARSFRLNSSGLPSNHPILSRIKLLGLKPFGSPTLSDQSLMSFPSIKIGPGESSRSHTADEFIYSTEIREAIELYFKLLDGFNFE